MSSTDKDAPKHTGTDEEHEGWRAKTYAWADGAKIDTASFGKVDERSHTSHNETPEMNGSCNWRTTRLTQLSALFSSST